MLMNIVYCETFHIFAVTNFSLSLTRSLSSCPAPPQSAGRTDLSDRGGAGASSGTKRGIPIPRGSGPEIGNNVELRRGDGELLSPGARLQAGPTTPACRGPLSYNTVRRQAVRKASRVPAPHTMSPGKVAERFLHFQGVSSTKSIGD
jgi:hypothetical protein